AHCHARLRAPGHEGSFRQSPRVGVWRHRARDLLVRQRTAAVNALRGHLAEFGIVAARGTAKAHELMRLAGDDERLPAMAQEALRYIVAQIHDMKIRLKSFEQRILSPRRKTR